MKNMMMMILIIQMKKKMKKLKELIFGVRAQPVDSISTGITTLHFDKLPFNEWCKQLNVSIRYQRT
jgi:hypothetical protein